MLNLYWKIFLGFWLTGLALGGGAVFVSQQLMQDAPLEIRGLSPAELANRTSFIIRRLPADTNDWQTRLAENDIQLYLDTAPVNSLAASTPPDAVAKIFAQLETRDFIERSTLTRLTIGKLERVADGKTVKYVLDMPSFTLFRLRQLFEQWAVQLLLALAISAAACLVIARHLTRNLKQISLASRALAGGDLSARTQVTNHALKDELTVLAEDFNVMADSIQAGIENQKRLVRDISHELRSPLARLQIALELARQQANEQTTPNDNTTQTNSALNRIAVEADRLNEMIGQLLAMPEQAARLDDTVDLEELLRAIIDDNQIEATKKSVKLEFSRRTATDEALVSANASQLHSALENIIRNAIHYTNEGTQVTVTLADSSEPPAAVNGVKANKCESYCVSVSDCGPGVPQQDLPRIFDPFYRVDRARNRKTGGYGIGLAIVHRVIAAHHGKVHAHNGAHGLVVEVLLPKLTPA